MARYDPFFEISIGWYTWTDVLRDMSADEVERVLAVEMGLRCKAGVVSGGDNEWNRAVGGLVLSLHAFLHGNPWMETLYNTDMDLLLKEERSEVYGPLCGVVMMADCADYSRRLPSSLLYNIFYDKYALQWKEMPVEAPGEMLRTVFLENENIDGKVRRLMQDEYLFLNRLWYTGPGIAGQLSEGSGYRSMAQALLHLHHGEYQQARELFLRELKNNKAKYFDDALLNLGYAIALVSDGTAESLKKASTLAGLKKLIGEEYAYPMLLVLYYHFGNDVQDYAKAFTNHRFYNLLTQQLTILVAHHYQLIDNDMKLVASFGKKVAQEGLPYMQLLYADDFDALQPQRERLYRNTGLERGLLPLHKHLAPWEMVIDKIEKIVGADTKAGKKGDNGQKGETLTRVVYMLDPEEWNVTPKLQRSNDGGATWTRGRNIALSNFGSQDNLTEQDRRVANLVVNYSYGWYGGTSYSLGGDEVVAALAGCPAVFWQDSGVKVDIVKEPLQLQVQRGSQGFVVQSNISGKPSSSHYYIEMRGSNQIVVVEVSDMQSKILSLIKDIPVFPPESESQLAKMLQDIGAHFTVMSELMKGGDDIRMVEADARIAVQIVPEDAYVFSLHLTVKPFGDNPPYQRPGKGMPIVSTTIDGQKVQTERDLSAERSHLEVVEKLLEEMDADITADGRWLVDTAMCLSLLDALRQQPQEAYAEWPQGVKMRVVRPVITPDKVQLSISSAGRWFDMEGEVEIGNEEKIRVAELLERLRSAQGNFVRIGDDEYVALSEQLRRQLQAIDKMLIGHGKKQLRVATMNGLQLSDLEEMGAHVDADGDFRSLVERIREAESMEVKVPANLHAELRSYQIDGYRWMSRLAHWGAGACLADDMGLGKTVQSIALLLSRAHEGPQMVVMPTSVLSGWQQELQRFAPSLRVEVLNQPGANRKRMVEEAEAGTVVLSTYGLIVTERELLTTRRWTTIVLDEAHTIKNRDTQTSQGAMEMQADFRLLLTGTPVQNHLSEIWNLFQFANPGLLGSYQQFADRFIVPIERDHDRDRQQLLRRMLRPFLLRRTKEDVLSELPEKTEITLRVELSAEEKALYDNLRREAIDNLEEGNGGTLQALAEITRLRQAACHPRLVDDKINIASSKTQAFMELVADLMQGKHRALVFSQFTSHLALIREQLDKQQIPYLYLDGSTPVAQRRQRVSQFQTGDMPLFLISLKAGGLGLNLTAADYVIHLDPWWNPAIEDQASDRAHRIGQQRPVTIYRLISAGTIEEKILRLHGDKRSMADALLEGASLFTQISAEEIVELLREGN